MLRKLRISINELLQSQFNPGMGRPGVSLPADIGPTPTRESSRHVELASTKLGLLGRTVTSPGTSISCTIYISLCASGIVAACCYLNV